MRQWVDRTSFAEKMAQSLDGAPREGWTTGRWAKELEAIYAALPPPLQEHIGSRFRVWNMLRLLVAARPAIANRPAGGRQMIGQLTERLPNVRYVLWGHTHGEELAAGKREDRGDVGYMNTGSWTQVNGEWRLNIAIGTTDSSGRLRMEGLYRTDPRTGRPDEATQVEAEKMKIPGWKKAEAEPADAE
jgi:hypothetical protein